MDYLRAVDFAAIAAAGPDERLDAALLDIDSGATGCRIRCIRTPAGGGSPAGRHTHVVDQIFYIISGVMSLDVDGTEYTAGPGTLVVFPAGVPHRNWNAGADPTVHLSIDVPLPDPALPFATPAP